ncbi:uncharacterized protein LOC118748780 [Rhagoletis pomonella]|uniref:uncharacterized protein LOC118748780 n=1 Tax=Rhagoletis pomonella TaxID=28610 RepID=UPI00177B5EE5|nr:uncharacterized protein LOC118748780 [Rhagoletis pomonella]XP_036339351.1 uncharacterized protein LOC118748780 [Rhagoletis pomonella]
MEVKEEIPIRSKTVTVWTEGETLLLLDKYTSYFPDIGPFKQLKTKRDMWMKISAEFDGKSWKQCEERYKTIMKRKKAPGKNNSISGAKRQKLQFEELDEICQCGIKKVTAKEKQRKGKSLHETLIEIAARKEEARERRHKERMERAARIESLMEKWMADSKPPGSYECARYNTY